MLPSKMREWATSRSSEGQGNLGAYCSQVHVSRYPIFQSQFCFPVRQRRIAGAENPAFPGVLLFLRVAPDPTLQYY